MTVKKRGKVWYYDFGNHKYRGPIPEARTKHEAEQAEIKLKRDVFEGKYGSPQMGTQLFSEFVTDTYLPWAKTNKRTWRNDEYIANLWCERFRGKTLREISPLAIEKHKRERANSITRRGTIRSPASVNMELAVLSGIFTLAVDLEAAAKNPCCKVRRLHVDNLQYQYLRWEQEAALFAVLEDPLVQASGHIHNAVLKVTRSARAQLRDAIIVAIGAGLRRSEQLRLQPQHCDFALNLITVIQTKSYKRPRQVPMSDDVRAVLSRLCKGKRTGDFLFVNPKTKRPFLDHKKGFARACADAGIAKFTWRNLRDTFGTRLGEAGYNAFEIADLMGHSDIRTTQRYVKVEPRKHQAVQATMLSRKLGAVTIPSQTAEQLLGRVAVND